MKKLVTATLMLFQTVAYANSKYMKNSEEVIKYEKEVIFPEIIFSMYKENLSDRKQNLKMLIEDYNNNKIKLENLIIEFDTLHKSIDIPESLSSAKDEDLRRKIDRLESLKSLIRKSMFQLRESELRLRKIDKSLDNYCEESNSIFDSKKIHLQPLINGGSLNLGDNRYTSDILRIGVAGILEIKFKRIDLQNIEYWSVNESAEFNEAKNWYYQNTWGNQPDKIKELALSICKNLPSEFVLTEEQVKSKEFIFNFISHLKAKIDSLIQSINNFYNNKDYTTEQLKQIILRLDSMGKIDLNDLKRFDDKLTLFYIFMENEIDRIKNELKKSNYKFNLDQEIKESDSYKEESRQYENLSRARNIFYQDILHKSSQDLLKIYLNYQNNCKEYITQKQVLYAKIDSDVKKMRENYENDYNRNDPFFRNIDNKVSMLKDENNKRQQKICNK